MDLESLETQTLLKKRAPKRQSLALKLAVLLCGLGLLVGVAVPSTNRGDVQGKATLKEKEVTAAAGVSSTSRPASTTIRRRLCSRTGRRNTGRTASAIMITTTRSPSTPSAADTTGSSEASSFRARRSSTRATRAAKTSGPFMPRQRFLRS